MSSVFPNPAITPPGPSATTEVAAEAVRSRTRAEAPPVSGPSFADVLAQRTSAAQAPRFSRHALERVNRRGIELDQPTLQRLARGVSRAATKGSRDAVVFVGNTAFVVSVPNNTVITAVGSEHMREHVFTNIDSAVIA
ncbi:MAG TPA: TIGR02530 family flagellar biosynthesis protein [Solirubrobacteraceae bacterium]|nr:TIGR02530 family flagellar biosynthesis protein [Solirubrobacteraceae bacterium]